MAPIDIDRYQLTMDGETLFKGEFYKNLFINIYNRAGNDADDANVKFIETRRYYIPKKQWLLFLHFIEECPQKMAVDSIESMLKLPDETRIKRFEVKAISY